MRRATLAVVLTVIVLSEKGCWSDTKEVMGWGKPRWYNFDMLGALSVAFWLLVGVAVVAVATRRPNR